MQLDVTNQRFFLFNLLWFLGYLKMFCCLLLVIGCILRRWELFMAANCVTTFVEWWVLLATTKFQSILQSLQFALDNPTVPAVHPSSSPKSLWAQGWGSFPFFWGGEGFSPNRYFQSSAYSLGSSPSSISTTYFPIIGVNLKPWPEPAVATKRFWNFEYGQTRKLTFHVTVPGNSIKLQFIATSRSVSSEIMLFTKDRISSILQVTDKCTRNKGVVVAGDGTATIQFEQVVFIWWE